MPAEQKASVKKCPGCGSTELHPSRRRSKLEELSAFIGISYFRCRECKLRFSTHMSGFTSGGTRGKYELLKQRSKEIMVASVLLAIIVAALVWAMYHSGEG